MAPHVVLACPGLDHARRGFETFARECFEALHDRDDLRIELVKGSGPRGRDERSIPTLTRETRPARALARRRGVPPFVAEHVAFGLALVPLLERRRPDVVYFSEWHLGRVLRRWRRARRARCALVFCNGALVAGGYEGIDRVQQLSPAALEYSVARGEPADRQVVLPLGVRIPPALAPVDRAALRRELGLPADRMIVLSVGALERLHKRMDLLIAEVASLPAPRPFLLLAGQREDETPAIEALARERLGAGGHAIRTVAPAAMGAVYGAADAFVLASRVESFGRVLVEALSHGLPCLAQRHPVIDWVLGDAGETADLAEPGTVAGWLARLPAGGDEERRRARHRSAHERFSWEVLADRYAALLTEAAAC